MAIHNHLMEREIYRAMDTAKGCDFGQAVDAAGADFNEYLTFPNNVHSVAG